MQFRNFYGQPAANFLRHLPFCVILFSAAMGLSQEVSGLELLDKSIQYHDPSGAWDTFRGRLSISMSTPDQKERVSDIKIDLREEYFELKSSKEGTELSYILDKETCELTLNGSRTFSEEEAEKNRLNCERGGMMKNYYTYLYGLPMKLKDSGTQIHDKVSKRTFKGKEYLVLKVAYDEEVGKDTWYFYFDPETYAMEVYQFFHEEAKNDGEYILLTGMEQVGPIKMPKIRAWYYNKDDTYLGTDRLGSGSTLD